MPLFQPDAWRPFVMALRSTIPPGVREAEFRGTLARGSFGGSIAYDGDTRRAGLDLDRGDRPMDALRPLSALVDGAPVAVRAVADESGAATVSIVAASPQLTFGMGHDILETVLLVAGADPEPYRRVPVRHDGAAVSPGADPAAVTALVGRLLPAAQPADPSALAAAESGLGARLPDDVRALYLAAGSGELIMQPTDEDLFYGFQIMPLDDAAARSYLEPPQRYLSWAYGATEAVAPDPHERVQALATSPAWFVIGDDWGGNLYVVDLAPGPQGTVGQVLFVDHETTMGASWVAPSLTELLTRRPAGMSGPGPQGALVVRVGPRSGKTVADVRPETEVLFTGSALEPVDLSPLAGHGRLRTLVGGAGTIADLAAITGLPALEYLQLDIAGWQELIRAGQVPPNLLAAGLIGRADWAATVEVVNDLLAAWDLPAIEVTEIRPM
ncbi:cell wall assembly regulator SMI1 [Allocatelliglobosispora scoriae]|uniref:Cell wall assembly regulator SMI1 n=1 Tax=Allocatelliglobosispora scoriae TaxID=643052 RepID=A0A841BI70_9ACTN|nr:SMI1/KNR4 family protein [Allocatelliglobosispora scoriae]MBB5867315.1 cell wall assembly regulator SMI1 [Allocatelliglobosispora scoriae]